MADQKDPLTGFLKPHEKRKLQGMYEKWLNEVKLEHLITKLYNAGLVSNYDRQRIDAERTDIAKSQIIFHDILMRSPYEDLARIRRLMIETGEKNNIYLAREFPTRGETIDFTAPKKIQPGDNHPIECQDRKPEAVSDMDIAVHQPDPRNLQDMETEPAISAALATKSKKRITRIYETKSANKSSPTGKGLCVIIRNFTDDLKGYEKDAEDIRYFFEDFLKYDVFEGKHKNYNLVNVCFEEFKAALEMIADTLRNEAYDRFFLFILSHGDEKGIKMCKRGSSRDEEEGMQYPEEDIINMFTHDKIPSMKDVPKCFFIQACRGTEVAKRAAYSDIKEGDIIEEEYVPPHLPLTVGADILVCFPSGKGHYSWVYGTGSWFIQHTLGVFRQFYQCEHMLDMMSEAGYHIGTTVKTAEVSSSGTPSRQECVSQMPHYVTTLTRKFYLASPPPELRK